MVDLARVEQKLSAARTRLILDRPFLGALVLRLPLVAADPKWCPTTGTDARKFYYNPDYIWQLNDSELQFVLAHEALHCGLLHFARRNGRTQHLWDIACDYAVNPLLINEGLQPPPNAPWLREYENMTAEEIYPLLGDNENDMDTMDKHLYDQGEGGQRGDDSHGEGESDRQRQRNDKRPDPGEGEGKGQQPDPELSGPGQGGAREKEGGLAAEPLPLSEREKQELAEQWQQKLAGAAQMAMQAGKLGENWVRLVDHLLEPQLPWQALLARYMTATARDDYSWQRPNSRREGPAIFPSLKNGQVDITVAIDVSGSIADGELQAFLGEVNAIKSQINARITLLACDAKLSEGAPWVFEPWEECRLPEKLQGGGGTDFRPVFQWLEQQDRQPDLLVWFTDAQGRFPEQAPHCPVLWLVKGRASIPFGQRIQLN